MTIGMADYTSTPENFKVIPNTSSLEMGGSDGMGNGSNDKL